MLTSKESHRRSGTGSRFTGKQIVMLAPKTSSKTISTQADKASLKFGSFNDYRKGNEDYTKAFEETDGIVFEKLGIIVVNGNLDKQVSILTGSSSRNTFIYSEPERYVYAINDPSEEFTQDSPSVTDQSRRKTNKPISSNFKSGSYKDDDVASWGIHAANVLISKFTGKGINTAILDTGFNLNHPDFDGRILNSRSFIQGEEAGDQNGHGSHCTGISTGNINRSTGRRYGVAKEANIYIGKVLSNDGSGSDSGILAGMEWAITNNCKVISMSLGAAVEPGETYSNIYNDIAKKALAKGTLIIAAAGNESRRDLGIINPVGHPANCPAIMAVAALDKNLNVAYFSCGGINSDGGQVDIAAPGVDIYSSWVSPENYNIISGTSMATPCVAGIAALFCEAFPKASASDIWMYLKQYALRLNLNASDVGAGLVQPLK
jgi:subtilisin family serine protease